jgi:hypothetical protein
MLAGDLRGGLRSRGAGGPLRAPGRRTVALLPGEPPGTITTRAAGAIEFEATLAWRHREEVPLKPMLPELRDAVRCSIAETEGPEAATRCLAGEIKAFSPEELGAALEAVLRCVTAVAGLTEAMLEVGAVRSVPPRVASPRALEELAYDLWSAGFPVRFGASWTPAPEADVYVGSGGGVQEFLRSHPSWSLA